jgi:Tfp pilus assembly protein PilF
MKRDDPPADPWSLPPEQIELAVAAIEASRAFRGSRRHRTLLRHLVSQALDGNGSALKETVIAIEVFGRPADRFDPKQDSIVRVETRRLRARLARYYAGEGRDSPLRVELPVGSYVPLIVPRRAARAQAAATRRARDLVERGEHFLRLAATRANLEQAIGRFDAALRESPGFAPALVGLARAWFNMAAGWYGEARLAGEHAREALRRALEVEPGNALAWALLGAVQHQMEHDWAAAQRSFRRALEAAPDQAFVHTAYGWQLMARGRFDEAELELKRARELDPQYLNSRMHMINLRIAQGRFDDALHEADALADLAPEHLGAIGAQAMIALQTGRYDDALRHYGRAAALAPDHPGVAVLLAAAHAAAGRAQEADARLAAAADRDDGRLSPYVCSLFAVWRGRPDDAFAVLERALDERDPQAVLLATDPSFRPLHRDRRWPALLERLGLRSSRR